MLEKIMEQNRLNVVLDRSRTEDGKPSKKQVKQEYFLSPIIGTYIV